MSRLITWQLWKAVYFPPRAHPLFRRMTQRERWRLPASWLVVLALVGLALACLIYFRFPAVALLLVFIIGVGVPLSLMATHATLLALWWSWHISDALLDARRDSQDDLLNATPGGLLGAGWLISTGLMHRGDWLRQVHRVVRLVLLLVTGSLVALLLTLATAPPTSTSAGTLIISIVSWIALAAAFWLDHTQSILLAPLLGMLLPQLLAERFLVRIALLLGLPLLQLGTWALAALLYAGWRWLLFSLTQHTLPASALAVGLGVLSFFLLRETLLAFLWRALLRAYNAEAGEFSLNKAAFAGHR